jgi:putative copper resistance protein D
VFRLGRLVLLEALLVAGILGAVAVLGLTTPARHDPIAWPLSFRFAWDTTWEIPGVRTRAAVGSQFVIVGLLTALFAVIVRGRWWHAALAGATIAVAVGLAVALPPLVVDAYPTTYVRPAVPYATASIARGQALYREHCAGCHGADGAGDARTGSIGPRSPDLTGRHATRHTAGDLFWWVTRGVEGARMPGFGARLTPEQRWDIVNFLRALAAAEQARGLTPSSADQSSIVAPDLGYTTGVGGERSLREYRGQTVVLLVFFRLPDAVERLSRLGRRHFDFRMLGAEIIGVPLEQSGAVYRALGSRPALFPFAIEGAEPAAATYGLFRRDRSETHRGDQRAPGHMELLIDRQGYLRARWLPRESPDGTDGWGDLEALIKEVGRLTGEVVSTPAPGDYVD